MYIPCGNKTHENQVIENKKGQFESEVYLSEKAIIVTKGKESMTNHKVAEFK